MVSPIKIIFLILSLCVVMVGPPIIPNSTRATPVGELKISSIVDIPSITKYSSESKLFVSSKVKAEETFGTEYYEINFDEPDEEQPNGWEVWHIVGIVAVTCFFVAMIMQRIFTYRHTGFH